MNYILFDESQVRANLLPLTFMRPVAEIRIGILTIREKWEKHLKVKTSTLTEEDYLSKKFPLVREENNVLINGCVCPNDEIIEKINGLEPEQILVSGDTIIAFHVSAKDLDNPGEPSTEGGNEIEVKNTPLIISNTYDIFSKNNIAIAEDFELITHGRRSAKLPESSRLIGNGKLFIEKGATVEGVSLNTSNGPIYIGQNSEIMEGAMIRGPFALCDHAQVKMGAKIYGPVTIGPHSRIGGEVNSSVIFGYSNKAHDGFLGHSVIAEWCNIGADSNTSNLKNTYDDIRLWNYPKQTFINTQLQFCGLIMGDHSKCGIDTMFNSGTVVGVNANIFGAGFQRNFIPSFTWGGTGGFTSYSLEKAIEVAEIVYKRRNLVFSKTEKDLLSGVFSLTRKNKWL
ncbi:MAG: GlmU family protein [Bacteroidota bacterium]|nr:GlmU family protein [Bacteroidota bacterium]